MTIIALIARNPMLRTAQIADRLDLTIDLVDALLRPLLIAGTVTEQEVIAPNQRPAMAYEVSEQFKLTAEYRTIMSGGEIEATPEMVSVTPVPAAPAPVAAPAPPAPAAPAPARVEQLPANDIMVDPAKPGTRVSRGIAFITANGSATNDQLRTAMGLEPGAAVSNYLGRAVLDGRLARDGDNWVMGSGEPPVVEGPKDEPGKPLQELKRTLADPVPPSAPSKPTGYRCALWSDGQIEIQRDGATLASLPREVAEELARFVGSLA